MTHDLLGGRCLRRNDVPELTPHTTTEPSGIWTCGRRTRAQVHPVFSHQGSVGFSSVTEADAFFWSLVEDIEDGTCGPDAWVGWDEFLVTPTKFICTSSVVEDLRAER